jgi:nucleolar protein 15
MYSGIPHGFFEHQMRAYFSQFGTVTRLRLSRNRKSGRSKHFGFIEFESAEVADIVHKVMDKYLLMNNILRTRRIPPDQVNDTYFKGANTRFKRVPFGDIHARNLKAPKDREQWERRIEREEKRREEKKKTMEDYGYDFDIPKLKHVTNLPPRAERLKRKDQLALEDTNKEVDGKALITEKSEEFMLQLDANEAIAETKASTQKTVKAKKDKKGENKSQDHVSVNVLSDQAKSITINEAKDEHKSKSKKKLKKNKDKTEKSKVL